MMSVSSSLSPEFDRARIASSPPIMPRSPWLASAGWTNCAGVPVEASVAAILRATWPLLPMPVTISRPRTAAHKSRTPPKPLSSVRPSCSSPSISALITRRATAMSRARLVPCRSLAKLVSPVPVDTAISLSPKTRPPGEYTLMREDVLLRPALKIKQCACRQEIKAGTRQLAARLARQHRIESGTQRMEMQYVGGGIAQLFFGQGICSPIRALLLLFQVNPQEILAQIPEPVLVGKGAGEPRRDLRAIDRLRHRPKIMVEHGDVEAAEMKQLQHPRIG